MPMTPRFRNRNRLARRSRFAAPRPLPRHRSRLAAREDRPVMPLRTRLAVRRAVAERRAELEQEAREERMERVAMRRRIARRIALREERRPLRSARYERPMNRRMAAPSLRARIMARRALAERREAVERRNAIRERLAQRSSRVLGREERMARYSNPRAARNLPARREELPPARVKVSGLRGTFRRSRRVK